MVYCGVTFEAPTLEGCTVLVKDGMRGRLLPRSMAMPGALLDCALTVWCEHHQLEPVLVVLPHTVVQIEAVALWDFPHVPTDRVLIERAIILPTAPGEHARPGRIDRPAAAGRIRPSTK